MNEITITNTNTIATTNDVTTVTIPRPMYNKETVYRNMMNFLDRKGIVYKKGHKKEGEFLYFFSKDNTNARSIEIWVRGANQYQLFTRTHIDIDGLENKYHEGYNLQYSNNFKSFEACMTVFIKYYNILNNTNINTEIYTHKTA